MYIVFEKSPGHLTPLCFYRGEWTFAPPGVKQPPLNNTKFFFFLILHVTFNYVLFIHITNKIFLDISKDRIPLFQRSTMTDFNLYHFTFLL